eukprot:TRINITY_DN37384_c0_g1_i1.p1 TRINITY_DN37384_c0_g1~~TRINITY_DN37384_c0_g1_i1.p1  ORF type:complete len:1011 (+),score=113.14 TRINITY_DN37384_c0_g1_i1:75-3035(+)
MAAEVQGSPDSATDPDPLEQTVAAAELTPATVAATPPEEKFVPGFTFGEAQKGQQRRISSPRADAGAKRGGAQRRPSQGSSASPRERLQAARRISVDQLCFADHAAAGGLKAPSPQNARRISFLQAVRAAVEAGVSADPEQKPRVSQWILVRALLRTAKEERVGTIRSAFGLTERISLKLYHWMSGAKSRAASRAMERRYRAMRDAMLADALAAGVATEVDADGPKVHFRNQGCTELHDTEALRIRSGLRQHREVVSSLREIWEILPHCPVPHDDKIDRQIYQWMSLRILDDLLPKRHRQGLPVRETMDNEWWIECRENFFMDFDLFCAAIFDFIDVWAEGTEVEEYLALARGVRDAVSTRHDFVYSGKLARRQYEDWKSRSTRTRRGPLAPETFPWSDAAMLHHVRICAGRRGSLTASEPGAPPVVSPGRLRRRSDISLSGPDGQDVPVLEGSPGRRRSAPTTPNSRPVSPQRRRESLPSSSASKQSGTSGGGTEGASCRMSRASTCPSPELPSRQTRRPSRRDSEPGVAADPIAAKEQAREQLAAREREAARQKEIARAKEEAQERKLQEAMARREEQRRQDAARRDELLSRQVPAERRATSPTAVSHQAARAKEEAHEQKLQEAEVRREDHRRQEAARREELLARQQAVTPRKDNSPQDPREVARAKETAQERKQLEADARREEQRRQEAARREERAGRSRRRLSTPGDSPRPRSASRGSQCSGSPLPEGRPARHLQALAEAGSAAPGTPPPGAATPPTSGRRKSEKAEPLAPLRGLPRGGSGLPDLPDSPATVGTSGGGSPTGIGPRHPSASLALAGLPGRSTPLPSYPDGAGLGTPRGCTSPQLQDSRREKLPSDQSPEALETRSPPKHACPTSGRGGRLEPLGSSPNVPADAGGDTRQRSQLSDGAGPSPRSARRQSLLSDSISASPRAGAIRPGGAGSPKAAPAPAAAGPLAMGGLAGLRRASEAADLVLQGIPCTAQR